MQETYIENIFNKFYKDLQKYIFTNGIVVTASGFAIGIATKEVITKILSIIIVPVIEYLKKMSEIKLLWKHSLILIPLEIFWTVVMWFITIIFTFVLLEYFLNKTIFGMISTIKEDDEKNFIKSKVEAKVIDIIPKSEDSYVKTLNLEQQKINEIVSITKEEPNGNINKIIKSELSEFFEKYYH